VDKSIIRIFALVTALALSIGAALAASSGDARKGRALFEKTGCYECHGYVGQGALATGPKVARTELPLEAFTMALRSPASDMPPYEAGILSDGDAADIFAYLQSLPAPAKPDPLLLQGK
jgi:ubiquinol-cytochrome c reductase cytochrome c subunit